MKSQPSVELSELSILGFGCYRTDKRSRVHYQAMQQALGNGVNLFDTASSYMDGRSEELIGEVVSETSLPVFVVTKLGYITPSSADYLSRNGIDVSRLRSTIDGTPYSLDVNVLSLLLELSRTRLRRSTIDAVLLHNPERLLETGVSQEELRVLLGNAFEWLDLEAQAGRLRYYGVSSNNLPSAPVGDVLDLDVILQTAIQAGTTNQPSLIEFPLNLLEQDAATQQGRPSLLERAHPHVRTLTNRPLNCIYNGDPLRLALPTLEDSREDPWIECVSLVSNRLQEIASDQTWQSYRPMQFLRDYKPNGDDIDLIDAAWANQIRPFLDTLYEQRVPGNVANTFKRLYKESIRICRYLQAKRTEAVISALKTQGKLTLREEESVAIAACRSCLDLGADHVLVGMRRPEYVRELTSLMMGP
jgi:aryl-alcohol dehydrogenase-like predicted oxidoreductase